MAAPHNIVLFLIWTGLVEGLFTTTCDQNVFHENVHHHCLQHFEKNMMTSDHQSRCPWPLMKGPYNTLMFCVDRLANDKHCNGFWADKIYLDIHQTYFSQCEVRLRDPATLPLVMLIAPGILTGLLLPFICAYCVTRRKEMPCPLGL